VIFSGRISPHRRFVFGQLSLDDVKAAKNAHGTTVNDVVVSICAGAAAMNSDTRMPACLSACTTGAS